MKWIVLTYLLCLAFMGSAQFGQGDSVMLINGPAKLEPYQNRLKATFRFDARRTLFQKEWIALGGFRVGAEYRRIHRIGFGFYLLNTRVFEENINYAIEENTVELDFRYNSMYYERVLYFDRKWEFGGSLHLGGGNLDVYYNPDDLNARVKLERIPVNVAELTAFGQYNFFYWLGAGLGIGYRNIWGTREAYRQSFSSPVFRISVQINFFKIIRSTYDKSVKYEF